MAIYGLSLAETVARLTGPSRAARAGSGGREVFSESPDPQLWPAFRKEMVERLNCLAGLCTPAFAEFDPEDRRIETFAALRTIRQAATVVPLPAIVRVTLLLENLLCSRHDADWSRASLDCYIDWLEDMANSRTPTLALQAAGRNVESQVLSRLTLLAG